MPRSPFVPDNALLSIKSRPPFSAAVEMLWPELPEDQWVEVAWRNTAKNPWDLTATDAFGHVIHKADRGKRISTGWHVDHITPRALGGSSVASNLRALYWHTNEVLGALLGASH